MSFKCTDFMLPMVFRNRACSCYI